MSLDTHQSVYREQLLEHLLIWICFDSTTLRLGPFPFFGRAPGEPLPPLEDFRVARHTKANALGIKAERPNIRVIPKGRFRRVESVEALHRTLFGV